MLALVITLVNTLVITLVMTKSGPAVHISSLHFVYALGKNKTNSADVVSSECSLQPASLYFTFTLKSLSCPNEIN